MDLKQNTGRNAFKEQIRPIIPRDVPQLYKLITNYFTDPVDHQTFAKNIFEYFSERKIPPSIKKDFPDNVYEVGKRKSEESREELYALELGGEIIGITGIYVDECGVKMWLNWFGVDSAHRRKGFGTRLLKFAEERTLKRGRSELYVDTDSGSKEAIKLYKKCKYVEVGRFSDYFGSGEDRIFLMKDLRKNFEASPNPYRFRHFLLGSSILSAIKEVRVKLTEFPLGSWAAPPFQKGIPRPEEHFSQGLPTRTGGKPPKVS